MAEKGGAALLPPQRHGAPGRRPRRRRLVGQGGVEIRPLGRRRVPQGRVPRRPQLRGPSFGLCRARRGADAEFRQSRRPYRPRHDDRHVGDRRQLRPDRRPLPHFGRGRDRRGSRTLAGGAGDRRGRLLHRRALRGRRGRGGGNRRGARHGRFTSAPRRRSSTAPPAPYPSGEFPQGRSSSRAACQAPLAPCRASPARRRSIAPSSSSASTNAPAPKPRSTSCCAT